MAPTEQRTIDHQFGIGIRRPIGRSGDCLPGERHCWHQTGEMQWDTHVGTAPKLRVACCLCEADGWQPYMPSGGVDIDE